MTECHPYFWRLHLAAFNCFQHCFSPDILETPSYFCFTTLVYQTTEDCAGSDASVKLFLNRTYASVYKQLFMGIRDRYRGCIPVYTGDSRDANSVACATICFIRH